jgi:hypothetical protein
MAKQKSYFIVTQSCDVNIIVEDHLVQQPCIYYSPYSSYTL